MFPLDGGEKFCEEFHSSILCFQYSTPIGSKELNDMLVGSLWTASAPGTWALTHATLFTFAVMIGCWCIVQTANAIISDSHIQCQYCGQILFEQLVTMFCVHCMVIKSCFP
jgi:hypothetical protein